jgi:3-oxoadipate enol-lactonase
MPKFPMSKISVGDVALSYVDRGTGIPLLLVHGFPLDHSMWSHQIEELSSFGRVLAPDLRGFGQSGVTEGTVTMERFADDLAALLDAVGVGEPVVFCGLSMGGYIGWQFWKRHPSRLRALVLCDSRAAADSAEGARARRQSAEKVLSQ